MIREENIFVAKRNIIDYIWKSARLERLAVTYPDTEAIYNGMSVQGVRYQTLWAVNNLKHSWQFILDTLDYPLVCKINQCVGGDNQIIRVGYLCNMPVSIGGTTWKPDMPIESQIKEELAEIAKIDSPADRALTMMLFLVRKQMFFDGNKRTSMLGGNHVMISNGCGIIFVLIELQPMFTGMLIRFYESNEMREIKQFLYENCIDGIEFVPLSEQEREETESWEKEDEIFLCLAT